MQTLYTMLICVTSFCHAVTRRERKLTQCTSTMASKCCTDDKHDDNDKDRLEVSIYPIQIKSNVCLSMQAKPGRISFVNL
mgnify:CR=1 FL=1